MRSITVQIPQPCHEHWDTMQPNERGRFCASCQKTVVDYSSLSDQEIVERLSQLSGAVCGRLSNDQLNRPLVPPKSHRASIWRSWISLLTLSVMSWQSAWAQRHPANPSRQPRSTQQPVKPVSYSVNPITREPHTVTQKGNWIISGRIMSEDSSGALSPVSEVDVYVNGVSFLYPYERYEAKTDSLGTFTITVPMQSQDRRLTVWPFIDKFILKTVQLDASPTSANISAGDIIIRNVSPARSVSGGGLAIIQAPSRWQKVKRKLFR